VQRLGTSGLSAAFPQGKAFRDRVRHRRGARAAASGFTETHMSADGYAVRVTLSPSIPPTDANRAKAQSYVDLLASHRHGSELAKLSLYIAPLSEIYSNDLCGQGSDACYYDNENTEYVADQSTPGSDFPLEYVVTHEYGHHIANNRKNTPWKALEYGPKYWSSEQNICIGVDKGRFFPGNQDKHYFDDPGENWAEGYAAMNYPGLAWNYNRKLKPDAADFAAARRDILQPWKGNVKSKFSGSLSGSSQSKRFRIPLTLDGKVSARLSGPGGAQYDLQFEDPDGVFARSKKKGSRDNLSQNQCGYRSGSKFWVRVVRRSGSGSFQLTVSYPG